MTMTATRPGLEQLANAISGQLVLPGQDDYDAVRLVKNMVYDRYPAAGVRAAGAADVVATVRYAREHDLPLSIRSGGHSFAGHSTNDGGIVLDLSQLQQVEVDPEQRIARAQPGVTSAVLGAAAQPHGLALSTGDTASVALGGLTLGGGIGYMVRQQGLTIDNLLSAQVITAEGELVRAAEDENPDLFWALRGGGGNFGIVTEFEYRLHPVGTILGGVIGLPATPEVIRNYTEVALAAPDGLTTIATIMQAPPAPFIAPEVVGRTVFAILVCYSGDLDEGEAAVGELRKLAAPLFEMVAPMPYPAIYNFTEEATHPVPWEVRSQFMHALPDDVIDASLAAAEGDGAITMLQFRVLGGQMARVPASATAFAHRDKSVMASAIAMWAPGTDTGAIYRKLDGWYEAVRPNGAGVYVNFLQDEPERIRDAYPAGTYERLVAVKQKYDPTNFFSRNQNVRPRAS